MFGMQFPEIVRVFAELITAEPQRYSQPPRAYLVGGYVRDALWRGESNFLPLSKEEVRRGSATRDIDIEVYGVSSERIKEILQQLIGKEIDAIGASFGVYKVFLDDGVQLDVSLSRTEIKSAEGHRGFLVYGDPNLSPIDALRRRDFTINAMLMDPLTGEVIDPYHGQKDLTDRRLKAVTSRTFSEDPLRVFRAMQFIARFSLELDPLTAISVKCMVMHPELQTISPERITEEWRKMLLKGERIDLGIKFLHEMGLMKKMYPEMIGDQKASGPVMPAIREISDFRPSGPTDLLSDDDRIIAALSIICYNMTQDQVKSFLAKFTFGKRINDAVHIVLANCDRPADIFLKYHDKKIPKKEMINEVRKLCRDILPITIDTLLIVYGAIQQKESQQIDETCQWFSSFIKKHNIDSLVAQALVSGSDILDFAKKFDAQDRFLPGPIFGELLQKVEEARDRADIETPHEARAYLEQLMQDMV